MEEQKLTDQVIASEPIAQEPASVPSTPVDNLEIADKIMENLFTPFSEALYKLSNNELRKLIKVLVQFPFVKVKKSTLNDKQKVAFMFGERLIYANMVKRARLELERTFGEVEKEQNEGSNSEGVENVSSSESSTSSGTNEAQGNPQV
jgi:hypothetical protein